LRTLYIDTETYGTYDLRRLGVYRYTEDPEFLVLMATWAVDDGPVQVAFSRNAIARIPGLRDPDTRKVAHNAGFDRVALSRLLEMPTGTYLPPEEWEDTAVLAAEQGLPRDLKGAAEALGAEPKDSAGEALIRLFSKPRPRYRNDPRAGTRTLPSERPEEWAQFVQYALQDTATLRDVHRRVRGWPSKVERAAWTADQRINDRGVRIDTDLARDAVAAADENRVGQKARVRELTGVANPGSQPQMLAWFHSQGLPLPNLTKETVAAQLKRRDLAPDVREVLELRQDLALVAANKFAAALAAVSPDDRLRGMFRFHGAHTGRWTGRAVQLHNLPRASLADDAAVETAILDLALGLGAEADTLKKLVRSMLVGPFTVVDYSSIEARVIAWLAGEEWALGAFAAGRDIYVETAERMGGLTRQQGKVAVLALGFQGGVNSMRIMGGEGTDDELQRMVWQWRDANPAIVRLWSEMDTAFIRGGPVGEHISVERDGASRYIRLPSGRKLGYHKTHRRTVPSPRGPRRVSVFWNPVKRKYDMTYGGKLTENVTQAVARDVLSAALVRLTRAGYDVVGHVHDEVIVGGAHSVEDVRAVMVRPPRWARGLPIDGAGYTSYRYRKD